MTNELISKRLCYVNKPDENIDDGVHKTKRGFSRLRKTNKPSKAISQRLSRVGITDEERAMVLALVVDIYPDIADIIQSGDRIKSLEEKNDNTLILIERKNGSTARISFPTPSDNDSEASVNLMPSLVLSNKFERINIEQLPKAEREDLLAQINKVIETFTQSYKSSNDSITKANLDLLIKKRSEIFGVQKKEEQRRTSSGRLTSPLGLLKEVVESTDEKPFLQAKVTRKQASQMEKVVREVHVRLQRTFGPGLNIIPSKIQEAKKKLETEIKSINDSQREYRDYETAKVLMGKIKILIKSIANTPQKTFPEEVLKKVDSEKVRKLYSFFKKLSQYIKNETDQNKSQKMTRLREILSKVFMVSIEKKGDKSAFIAKSAFAFAAIDVQMLDDLKEPMTRNLSNTVCKYTSPNTDAKIRETKLKFMGMDGDQVMKLSKSIIIQYFKTKGQTERYDTQRMKNLRLLQSPNNGNPEEALLNDTENRIKALEILFPEQSGKVIGSFKERLKESVEPRSTEGVASLNTLREDIQSLEQTLYPAYLESHNEQNPYESLLLKASHLTVMSEKLSKSISDYKKVCEKHQQQKESKNSAQKPKSKNDIFWVSDTTASQAVISLKEYEPLCDQSLALQGFISNALRRLRDTQQDQEVQMQLKLMDKRAHEFIKRIIKTYLQAEKNSSQIDNYIGLQHLNAHDAATKYPTMKEKFEDSQKKYENTIARLQALIMDTATIYADTYLQECYRDLNLQLQGLPGINITQSEKNDWTKLFSETSTHENHIRNKLSEWQNGIGKDKNTGREILQSLDVYIENVVKPHVENVRKVLHRVNANTGEITHSGEIQRLKNAVLESKTGLSTIGKQVTSEQITMATSEMQQLVSKKKEAEASGDLNRVALLEAEIKKLKDEKIQLEKRLAQYETELAKSPEERVQEVLTGSPTFDQGEIETLKKELEEQTHRAQGKSAEFEQLNASLSELRTSKEELQKRCDENEKTLLKVEGEKTELKQKFQKAQSDLEKSTLQLNSLQEELKSTQAHLTALEQQSENDDQATNSALKEQFNQKISSLKTQVETLKAENSEKEQSIRNLQLNISSLNEQIDTLKTESATLLSEKTGAEQSLQTLEAERNTLQTQYQELQEKNMAIESEKASVHQQLQTLQGELETLQRQGEELNSAKNTTVIEKQNAEQQLQTLQAEFKTLNEQYTTLEKKKNTLLSEKSELEESIKSLQNEAVSAQSSMDQKISDMRSELKKSRQEAAQVKSELKTLQSELQESGNKNTELTHTLRELTQQIQTAAAEQSGVSKGASEVLEKQVAELKLELEKAQKDLKNKERRIVAFISGGKVRDKNRDKRNKKLKEIQKSLGLKDAELEEKDAARELVEHKLQKERDDHDQTYEELEKKSDELEKLYEGESEDLMGVLAEIKDQIDEKSKELERLQLEVLRLTDLLEGSKKALETSQASTETLQETQGEAYNYITNLNTQSAQILYGAGDLDTWKQESEELMVQRRTLRQQITKLKRVQQNTVKVTALSDIIDQLQKKQQTAQKNGNTERAQKLQTLIAQQQEALKKTQRSVNKASTLPDLEKQLKQVDQNLSQITSKIQTTLEVNPQQEGASEIIAAQNTTRAMYTAIIQTLLQEQTANIALLDETSGELPKSAGKTFKNLAGQWQREVDREEATYELSTTQAELERVKKELLWAQENPKEFLRLRLQEAQGDQSSTDSVEE
ncbi:MAG: hypothetical protein P1V18_01130 [Candidatus Gracilibacteria bacterium]|nr:hypothetical protein [Candidatus Gracilibacteria bacterium]